MRSECWVACVVACVSCGSPSAGNGDDAGADVAVTGGDAGDAAPQDGAPIFGDASSGDADTSGCSDAAKLVYTLSTDKVLRSFDPATLTFATIGTLSCQTNIPPNSMAVSRDATAYVNLVDGTLWKVSTKDASCTKTTFQPVQANRIIRGMGFAADSPQSTSETFYACTDDSYTFKGAGLAKIALPSFQLTPIGDYTNGLAGADCELTGTGNAQLFGFFAQSSPPELAEITKSTGATPSPIKLNGVSPTGSYAFSFWGGDFWFYTQGNSGSDVTRYKYATDKSLTKVITGTGFTIIGAGVSTCAPVVPPN